MLGRPFCRRTRSRSRSFLSCERERRQRPSLERDLERRYLGLLERDDDRDRLLLGDLRQGSKQRITISGVMLDQISEESPPSYMEPDLVLLP